MHGPDFYEAMWQSIDRTGFWQGENRVKQAITVANTHSCTRVLYFDEQGTPIHHGE